MSIPMLSNEQLRKLTPARRKAHLKRIRASVGSFEVYGSEIYDLTTQNELKKYCRRLAKMVDLDNNQPPELPKKSKKQKNIRPSKQRLKSS